MHPLKWLAHHYLFFRIPLLHPDRFLRRTLPYVTGIAHPALLTALFCLSAFGVLLVSQRTELYLGTFNYFFTWRGALAYALTIVLVKLVHEFAHAYAARAQGNRVPTMGVAFMVLWPIPYTDITDAWRMRDRRKRLWISLAGVAAELQLAGLALFGWAVTPDGLLRSAFFVLSSATVVSSLLVNLNPGMRFDGYYILSDLLGIDNLQARAFAVTRWWYRTRLLGMDLPPPEKRLSARRIRAMLFYSVYAWIYRFFLYLGIAVLVYYKFAKALGVVLFVTEIYFFILQPVVREGREVWSMRERITRNRRTVTLAVVLLLVVLWFALPLPRLVSVPAVAEPAKKQMIYVPEGGVVREHRLRLGERVTAGDLLLCIDTRMHAAKARILDLRIEECRIRIAEALSREDLRGDLPSLHEQLSRARAERERIRQTVDRNRIRALCDGIVCNVDPELRSGIAWPARMAVAEVVDLQKHRVLAYVTEDWIADVAEGDHAWFMPAAAPQRIDARVARVRPQRIGTLRTAALAGPAGGEIPATRNADGQWVPVDTVYEMELSLEDAVPDRLRGGQVGHVFFFSAPTSYLASVLRHAWRVILRESGF